MRAEPLVPGRFRSTECERLGVNGDGDRGDDESFLGVEMAASTIVVLTVS